jgi:transposase-like protein
VRRERARLRERGAREGGDGDARARGAGRAVVPARAVRAHVAARLEEAKRERYRAWCRRDLAEHDLVYCFLDAIYLKLRPEDEPAEGVLCAWGMTLEGRKVLLGLQLGSRESYEDWLDFVRDLSARGLRCPAVVADGAPGVWKAVVEGWPRALGQRCTVHKLRNLLAKLPERLLCALPGLGRARARQPWLARRHHDSAGRR